LLQVFREHLNVPIAFDATELESALLEPSAPTLLKDLHISLLKVTRLLPSILKRLLGQRCAKLSGSSEEQNFCSMGKQMNRTAGASLAGL
jgi:hypothetical protein